MDLCPNRSQFWNVKHKLFQELQGFPRPKNQQGCSSAVEIVVIKTGKHLLQAQGLPHSKESWQDLSKTALLSLIWLSYQAQLKLNQTTREEEIHMQAQKKISLRKQDTIIKVIWKFLLAKTSINHSMCFCFVIVLRCVCYKFSKLS